MNTAKLNDWLQVVGLFGVIASLIFVGLQMKQDRDIALVSIYQARAAAVAETNMAIASNKDVLRSIIKESFMFDPDEPIPLGAPGMPTTSQQLTGLELFSRINSELATWMLYDNSHFQYQQGFLPESHWERVRTIMKTSLRNQVISRWVFEIFADAHRADFREEILVIISEIEAEA